MTAAVEAIIKMHYLTDYDLSLNAKLSIPGYIELKFDSDLGFFLHHIHI